MMLGLTEIAGAVLSDDRRGKNTRHFLSSPLRQSVFGRAAGYDPAMRWIVGGRAATKHAASTSQMGSFETEWLANDESLVALADPGGRWPEKPE